MEALARRAVACKHWRWLPGSRAMDGIRRLGGMSEIIFVGRLPDFDDPATLGCLLALVREAWRIPSLACTHEGGWDADWNTWTVRNPPGRGHGCAIASMGCASEAEALVVALEVAP